MRQRRYVDDLGHFDTAGVDGADGGFTAVARTLHIYFDLSQTGFQCNFGSIFGSCLRRVRRVFLGAFAAEDQEMT